MSEQVQLRVGESTFTVKRSVLNKHPCSLLGRAFDRDGNGSAGLRQSETGEYLLGAAEIGDAVAGGPPALFASLLGSYSTGILIPVPGCTREQLMDAAEALGIDWARTAHDLVASDSKNDIARGVRLFSVHVLSTHADDVDALLWAALGLHRLGRHRESAVLLARLLDNHPDNTAARSLAVVVADARARSRRIGFVIHPSSSTQECLCVFVCHAFVFCCIHAGRRSLYLPLQSVLQQVQSECLALTVFGSARLRRHDPLFIFKCFLELV